MRKCRKDAEVRRKALFFGAKILLSVLFLGLVLHSVNFREVTEMFRSIVPYRLFSLLGLSVLAVLAACLKWQVLLRAKGWRVSFPCVLKLYLVGFFVNNLLPGMVGGDAARGFFLARRLKNRTDAYLSVFMTRLTGLLVLVLMVIGLSLAEGRLLREYRLGGALGMVVLLTATVAAVAFSRNVFDRLLLILPARFTAVHRNLGRLHEALNEFRAHRGIFVAVLALSLVFHILAGLTICYACFSFGFESNPLRILTATPFILLVSMIPITINGLGLWEGSFVVFLSYVGVPPAVAFSAALLLRIKNLLVSAVGALALFSEREAAPRGILRQIRTEVTP